MSGLVLAILADNTRACLEEQIPNVRACVRGAHVVVFNGGPDRRLTHGLDVDVCPCTAACGSAPSTGSS